MKQGRRGVRNPQKEKKKKKHLWSDRGAWETAFKNKKQNNILTIPLQSCSLLYYNTHVHAHRLRMKKIMKTVREVMKIITSTLLVTGWTKSS